MRFIYDHQRNRARDARQHLRVELFVHQALRVDKKDVVWQGCPSGLGRIKGKGLRRKEEGG